MLPNSQVPTWSPGSQGAAVTPSDTALIPACDPAASGGQLAPFGVKLQIITAGTLAVGFADQNCVPDTQATGGGRAAGTGLNKFKAGVSSVAVPGGPAGTSLPDLVNQVYETGTTAVVVAVW